MVKFALLMYMSEFRLRVSSFKSFVVLIRGNSKSFHLGVQSTFNPRCIYACVCLYTYIYIHIYVHEYMLTYVYIYVYIDMYLFIYIYMNIQIHVCMHFFLLYTHLGRNVFGFSFSMRFWSCSLRYSFFFRSLYVYVYI